MELEAGKEYEVNLKFKVVDIENPKLGELISSLDRFIGPFNWGMQQNGIRLNHIRIESPR